MEEHANAGAALTVGSELTGKMFFDGTERAVHPSVTLKRIVPLMGKMGITRMANITGLDRIGLPVVAVCRPNSRSLSVSQGKGRTLASAQVSGLMEAVECFHAEHVELPLVLRSCRELRRDHRVVAVAGLPRLSASWFHEELPLLWVAGSDMAGGGQVMVPYEMVHLDFRLPLPTGSGAFLISSNGLASGNHACEAFSHAICELIERDANTMWRLSGEGEQAARRLDPATVDDPACLAILGSLEAAGMLVSVWDTTSDVGIASFLCTVADRDSKSGRALPPIAGSGCHPRRGIALSRALTEAAQGRLTIISGSRDDISAKCFGAGVTRATVESSSAMAARRGHRASFRDVRDVAHDSFEADVEWELLRLSEAGFHQVIAVNLTRRDFGIPVVRVLIPYLEAMSEGSGYVPGARGRRKMQA